MNRDRMQDALNSGRCMICHFIEKDESDLLIKWASTGENIHKGLCIGESFCNHHFWKLSKVVADVDVAALNGFLLEQFLSDLDSKDEQQTEAWLQNYRDCRNGLSEAIVCPICGRLFKREREYIESIIAFLEDKKNVSAYEKSRGLCTPHFIKVFLSLRGDLHREQLRVIQKSHMIALIYEFREYIRKKLPPLRWERSGAEKLAYWRSLEKLVGRQGSKWR